MTSPRDRFLLFADAANSPAGIPCWNFTLHDVATGATFTASDEESAANGERLELLAVVRGLEALEQGAHVTLLTRSQYVLRGLQRGLSEWRRNHWRWERFGRFAPIRDCDLWLRIDHALQYHELDYTSLHLGGVPAREAARPGERFDEPAVLDAPHFLRRRRVMENDCEPTAEATFAPLSAAAAEAEAVLIVRTRRDRLADMAVA